MSADHAQTYSRYKSDFRRNLIMSKKENRIKTLADYGVSMARLYL